MPRFNNDVLVTSMSITGDNQIVGIEADVFNVKGLYKLCEFNTNNWINTNKQVLEVTLNIQYSEENLCQLQEQIMKNNLFAISYVHGFLEHRDKRYILNTKMPVIEDIAARCMYQPDAYVLRGDPSWGRPTWQRPQIGSIRLEGRIGFNADKKLMSAYHKFFSRAARIKMFN